MGPRCCGGIEVLTLCVLLLAGCTNKGPPRYGFIDPTGQFKVPPQLGFARDFSEGLAPVLIDGRWGYIDTSGKIVVEPKFGDAEPFSDGLAVVTTASRDDYWKATTLFGYIDRTGALVIPEKFNWAQPFSEGLAAACVGDCRNPGTAPIGYIDRTGEFVIDPQFGDTNPFSEGLAAVSMGRGLFETLGYIDKTGRFVLAPRFNTLAGEFSNGLAPAGMDAWYFDRTGAIVIPRPRGTTSTGRAHKFSDSLGRIEFWDNQNSVVFVDATGNEVLRGRCMESFSEGLAAACDDNYLYGFKNKAGDWVIPPRWERVGPFSGGLAWVCEGDCND